MTIIETKVTTTEIYGAVTGRHAIITLLYESDKTFSTKEQAFTVDISGDDCEPDFGSFVRSHRSDYVNEGYRLSRYKITKRGGVCDDSKKLQHV